MGDAHVLVKSRPVNAFSVAHEAPLTSFVRCAMREAGIPVQRDAHAAAILKDDGEDLVGHLDVFRSRGSKVSR